MAEKNRPLGLVENHEKPMGNSILGRSGVARKKQILWFSENLQKALVKRRFEHLHQVARKETDPWSPAAQHEIARGTIENPWENVVLAHGRTGGRGGLPRSHLRHL